MKTSQLRSSRKRRRFVATRLTAVAALLSATSGASALDVPVAGTSLSVSNGQRASQRGVKSIQKGAGIGFGAGLDPAQLSGDLEIYYIDSPTIGARLVMPPPWAKITRDGSLASFKNRLAPLDISLVASAKVRLGRKAAIVARSDGGIDLSSPPGPQGVAAILTMRNDGGSVTRMCSRYAQSAGSVVTFKKTARGQSLRMRRGEAMACPTCDDGVKNSHETGVDCGGGCAAACAAGQGCDLASDCASGVCSDGICQAPSCSDGIRNGNELGVDCGGGTCGGCDTGSLCFHSNDCASGVCTGFTCQPPTCNDGVENGAEVGVDCGGGTCGGCGLGSLCNQDSDCANLNCAGNVCATCASRAFTFHIHGFNFSGDSSWPGGTETQSTSTGCNVTVNRPSGDAALVCTLGDSWSVRGASGYTSCFGFAGANGDGVFTPSCVNAVYPSFGSVCAGRPSCSVSFNMSIDDDFVVVCE